MYSSAQILLRQVVSNSFALPTTALGTAYLYNHHYPLNKDHVCSCEASVEKGSSWKKKQQQNTTIPVKLKTRMTAIGGFSLHSETISNPSLITWFVATAGAPTLSSNTNHNTLNTQEKEDMSVFEFIQLWNRKDLSNRHPRFHSKVKNGELEYATPQLEKHVSQTLEYNIPRLELKCRIEEMLTNSGRILPLEEKLWEAQITNGPLGSSGAISQSKSQKLGKDISRETVVLFRSHHCIGDGVSLSAALMDLTDESEYFQKLIQKQLKKRRKKVKGFVRKWMAVLKKMIWFWMGSMKAFMYQGYLFCMSGTHPYQFILDHHSNDHSSEKIVGRSVSWCDAVSLSEANQVAKTLYSKATINDLFVTCVSAAITRQIAFHFEKMGSKSKDHTQTPSHINVVIPVHLMGGVLPPGYSLSNKIGAMAARIPTLSSSDSHEDALVQTSQTLSFLKKTPTALLSHLLAKGITSIFSPSVASFVLANSNQNAAFVLSNVRGPSEKIHWNGREVISMGGFVPLPPGMFVGIAVQTYNGMVSLTLNADKRIVPDADLFLKWVLEEYTSLCQIAAKKRLEQTK